MHSSVLHSRRHMTMTCFRWLASDFNEDHWDNAVMAKWHLREHDHAKCRFTTPPPQIKNMQLLDSMPLFPIMKDYDIKLLHPTSEKMTLQRTSCILTSPLQFIWICSWFSNLAWRIYVIVEVKIIYLQTYVVCAIFLYKCYSLFSYTHTRAHTQLIFLLKKNTSLLI